MVLFLLSVIAVCFLVLGVLTFRDLSPLRAFRKVVLRLTGIDLEPRPLPMDAPFCTPTGVPSGNRPLHRPIVLNIVTYEGTGQACHPDVLYIPEGFGSGN